MSFNPKEHLTKMGNREYLEVKWRLVWFREVHPLGRIETDIFSAGELTYVKAIVVDGDNHLLASGMATIRDATQREATWSGRIVEKAETAAIGRALAVAGFGTQFQSEEEDEGSHLADSPINKGNQGNSKPASKSNPPAKADKLDPATHGLGTKEIDIVFLKELTAPLYDNSPHQDNSIAKLIKDGVLKPDMNVDTAAAYVFMHRAAGKELGFNEADVKLALGMTLGEFLKRNPRRYGLAWEHLLDYASKQEMPE